MKNTFTDRLKAGNVTTSIKLCVSCFQIMSAQRKLNLRAEAGLVGSVVLLIHIIPYLSDSTLMDILQVSMCVYLLLKCFEVQAVIRSTDRLNFHTRAGMECQDIFVTSNLISLLVTTISSSCLEKKYIILELTTVDHLDVNEIVNK